MNVKAKRITTIAMLCALAYVVMAVGRVPVVLFLKYDPKDVVITLGGLIWGPMTACLVSVLVSVLEMFTVSDTGILGCIMNILSTCAFACTASAIYRKKRTLAGAVAGLAAGCAVMVSAMLLWNYLITPLYMGYPREAVAELLLPAFLPFNLLKSGLNSGITFLLYKPVVSSLRKSGLIDAPSGPAARRPVGLLLLAAVLVATCVLILLARNGLLWGGPWTRQTGTPPSSPCTEPPCPAPGWDGWRGCPPRACACTGDRRRRNPASTPRRSFWAVAASAGWRISRPAAARPPLSFSSFTVGKRPAGRRWSCASAKGSAAVSPLTTFPCCRHSSGWIASPPSPFGGFPPAPPGCPWSPQDDGRW